ncbi:MAG: hypothetical protein ACRD22_11510 [Terriglobia bacterium]
MVSKRTGQPLRLLGQLSGVGGAGGHPGQTGCHDLRDHGPLGIVQGLAPGGGPGDGPDAMVGIGDPQQQLREGFGVVPLVFELSAKFIEQRAASPSAGLTARHHVASSHKGATAQEGCRSKNDRNQGR